MLKIHFALILMSAFTLTPALRAEELPAGTTIEARLMVSTGSRISHAGDPVQATVIAPVFLDGKLLLPQGTTVLGIVDRVQRLRFGLRHHTALIEYRFDTLRFESGETVPVETRLVEVETAKERVDPIGVVGGIHPSANLSSAVSLYAMPFLYATPVLALPAFGIKSLIARTPDAEIYFPAGTEIILRLTDSVKVRGSEPAGIGRFNAFSSEEISDVETTLAQGSMQQAQKSDGEPADLVNIVFLGTRGQIDRAFQAAGWATARRHSPKSLYCIYQGMVERIGDRKASMSNLTLGGVLPDVAYEKGLDTFSKRHHLRLWTQPKSDQSLWLSAATEDVALRVTRMRLTHATDPHIDNERAKILNDLAFAGCVDAAALLPPPPGRADFSKDGPTVTDGNIAVIRLNDCRNPRAMPVLPVLEHGRTVRGLIAFRNDIVRSNIVFTSYNTTRLLLVHSASFARSESRRMKHNPEHESVWVRTSLLDVAESPRLRAQ